MSSSNRPGGGLHRTRTGVVPTVAALSILFTVGCAAPGGGPAPAASADPRFDWFEYRGDDPIFRDSAAGPGEYQNPILSGFYPDPSITRAGEDYYLVHSTFAYFPGIPVFHSRDLVSWTQVGNAIHRPTQLDFDSLGLSRGVFAPTIEHHRGTFYVLNTCVDCGGNFLVTATDPAGPWSDPTWLPQVGGIDPSLFFDDDGRAWVLNNDAPIGPPLYEGHRAIWIQEFNPETKQTFGSRTLLVSGGVRRMADDPATDLDEAHMFESHYNRHVRRIAARIRTGSMPSTTPTPPASTTSEPYTTTGI